MVHLHLVSAELGAGEPCTFHFQLRQPNGDLAKLDVTVRRVTALDGSTDVAGTYAAVKRELAATLLHGLIDAHHLDDRLTPAKPQELPNERAVIDLRRPANDHQMVAAMGRRHAGA